MPVIDSMAHLRALSQTQGSFIRLDQNSAQLTASTTQARFWQLSQRLTERRETRAAAERVRDSICAHCGKAAGTFLFNRYIGEKSLGGTRFTGSSLTKLLDAATRYNVSYLQHRLQDFAGHASLLPDIQQELNRIGEGEEDFMSLIQQTVRIVEGDFFSDEEVAQTQAALNAAQQKLMQLQNTLNAFQSALPQGAPGVPRLQRCVSGLIGELRGKAALLNAQQDQNPFSGKNVRTAFKQIYAAYETVIRREITRLNQELAGATPQKAVLLNTQTAALNGLLGRVQTDRAHPPAMQNVPDSAWVSKEVLETFRKLPQTLGKELHAILRDVSSGRLAREIKTAHIQVLNTQPWNVIQRDVQYFGQAGASVTATSTITPARHIGTIGQSMARDNLQGVSCGDRGQARHAVNLACTEISAGGTTLFRGLRHGVNSAYTLTNTAARVQANNTRALEIFTAAMQSSPELLQKAQAAGPNTVIDLPLLSTSLLTPDFWRRFGGGAERNHLREQCNAWQDACNQRGLCQIAVDIGGQTKTVTVRPQVITFNFGVNTGAQSTGKSVLGGWGTSMHYNEQAMAQLFGSKPDWQGGMVAQYLNRPGVSDKDRNLVAALRSQIIDLWENRGFRETGEDPYRLPARLAMLGHLMGMMPLFNCKSGKDRTGQMDVACKTLALQIHERNGSLPPLDEPGTSMDKHIFQQVAINGGNLEMQRLNTGLAGFKTSGVKGLDRLFSESAREMHRGLSHYVEV